MLFYVAGFRPGRRGPFVPAKGPKTIDAQPASSDWTDATTRRARQLAALRQGPPIDPSVRPEGRVAGVEPPEGTRSGVARGTSNEGLPLYCLPSSPRVRKLLTRNPSYYPRKSQKNQIGSSDFCIGHLNRKEVTAAAMEIAETVLDNACTAPETNPSFQITPCCT